MTRQDVVTCNQEVPGARDESRFEHLRICHPAPSKLPDPADDVSEEASAPAAGDHVVGNARGSAAGKRHLRRRRLSHETHTSVAKGL